jgi:hypothetical protein
MSEEQPYQERGEKEEKEEKEEEKEEKSWDEKWRRDPLSAAAWAVILIWAGVVWLASNLNMLNWIPFFETWSIFFLGASGILFLEILFRMFMPAFRKPVAGSFVLAIIFLAIGLGDVFPWQCIWPVVLIGIGLWLLYTGLFRRRE